MKKERQSRVLRAVLRGCTHFLATFATLLLVVFVLTSLVSPLSALLELAVHFSFHALIGAAILLPLLVILKKRVCTTSAAICGLYLVFVVQPWQLIPMADKENAEFANEVKVLSWNVLSANPSISTIEDLVQKVDPDLLVLIELRPGFFEDTQELLEKYPTTVSRPSWKGGGIAVLSRLPGIHLRIEEFGYPGQPAVVATLDGTKSSGQVQLVAMHTYSPMPVSRTPHRDEQLASFVKWSSTQALPLCLVGDLNVTPWTPSFQRIVKHGFQDSRLGVGNCASWPTGLGWFGLPIDHALTKGNCQIVDRTVLERGPGSDHLPISFTLRF